MSQKLLIYALFSLINIQISFGGEVDNYIAWEHEIDDESQLVNEYLNTKIQEAIEALSKLQSKKKCAEVAMSIIKKLGTNKLGYAALNTEFELWAQDEKKIDSYPVNTTTNREMRRITMYGWPGLVEENLFSIDRVVNIGGIYFGTDKFSHFAGSGYLYYKNYLKAQKAGKNKFQSIKYAIKKGHLMEGGIIGIKATGVFSYADQEANFQGMLMSIDMCEGDKPFLKKVDNRWQLNNSVDFRDYVNPYWDESYNLSGYTPKRISRMLEMIDKNGYCKMLGSEWVKAKWQSYYKYIQQQVNRLVGRKRFINYSISTILQMEKTDRDMRKILEKNDIYSQSTYALSNLCKN